MYPLLIGFRYLRSKKRATVSLITVIAILGVALGVSALLSVLSITSGFQEAFRTKVLGVNAHVLVLKYGLDFEEYGDVIARAREMPEVAGAAPFVINEMMIAKDDRLSGVLVKGVDPEAMPTVLDLPDHITHGSLEGLRLAGRLPPANPDRLIAEGADTGLDEYLRGQADEWRRFQRGELPPETSPEEEEALRDRAARQEPVVTEEPSPEGEDEPVNEGPLGQGVEPLPEVDVPTPEEVQAMLDGLDAGDELPTDDAEQSFFDEERREEPEHVDDEDLPGIIVGATLAENLGLSVGDRVQVISPLAGLDTSLWAPQARTPRSREFRVIAIFQAGFQEYDTRLVYIDLYEAQRFFDQGDTVTGVEIRLHDLEQAKDVAERIERDLGGGPFHTMDWEELNHNLFTALEIQKIMLSLVIAVIIIVAAFVVIATLIMMVLEKKREIAILKAMGAKDWHIVVIFELQGAVIGLVGVALGLLLGGIVIGYLDMFQFPLDPKVYLIDHLPVRVSPTEFIITSITAFVICNAATLYPSLWAAFLRPVEGVRYE
jgi:lipoprotein-releasing system permease protein